MPVHVASSLMEKVRSCYSDLKVCARGKRLNETLDTASKLGYRRVAVDVEVNFSSKKVTIPPVEDIVEAVGQATVPEGLEVLKRITLCVEDFNLLHIAQALPALQGYDLTALRTGSEKVFQACCSNINTDILALEVGERMNFTVKRSQVTQILERGVVFEVCYTPAIKDQSVRRHTLANIIELAVQTKGKGIIVSSGAEKSIEMRGPLDIINFCHLFGLKTEQCKGCVTTNCRQALLHSKGRKEVVKGVVSCRPLRAAEEEDTGKERKRKKGDTASKEDFEFAKKMKSLKNFT